MADGSLTGRRLPRELDRVAAERGLPPLVVGDDGTEPTSHVVLEWQQERGVGWHTTVPGKPVRNAFRSLIKRLRDERLDEHVVRGPPAAWRILTRGGPTITAPVRARASVGSRQASSPPGSGRTTTRTDSGQDREHIGGRVTTFAALLRLPFWPFWPMLIQSKV